MTDRKHLNTTNILSLVVVLMNELESQLNNLWVLAQCANISLDMVSGDKTMKEIRNGLEKIILETYHKHQIYFCQNDSTWRTYIPDDTKTNKRKVIKRRNKEDLEKFLVA